MQRTLKRALKVPEIAEGEPVVIPHVTKLNQFAAGKVGRPLRADRRVVRSFG